jgi:hypothetical protein
MDDATCTHVMHHRTGVQQPCRGLSGHTGQLHDSLELSCQHEGHHGPVKESGYQGKGRQTCAEKGVQEKNNVSGVGAAQV